MYLCQFICIPYIQAHVYIYTTYTVHIHWRTARIGSSRTWHVPSGAPLHPHAINMYLCLVTLNSKPSTLSPKLRTLKPEPRTPDPQP